jgi:hypothetical protein
MNYVYWAGQAQLPIRRATLPAKLSNGVASNAGFCTPVLRNSSANSTGSDRVHVEGSFSLPSSSLRIGPIQMWRISWGGC